MQAGFQHGLIRDVSHLKSLMDLLHTPIYKFEKENRFQIFVDGRKVDVQLMKGFYIHFSHNVRNGKKWIDISYSIREGNLNYFIGSFEFMRYSTKAHIVQFITQSLMGIMFDRMLLQGLVEHEGENVLLKIKNADTSFERVFWESISYKLKKKFISTKVGSSNTLGYLKSISIQL